MLYDGSPFHPDARSAVRSRRSRRASRSSARRRSSSTRSRKAGLVPRETHRLDVAAHDHVDGIAARARELRFRLRAIKPDVHLASISGGTDIVSCFVGGNPNGAGLARRDSGARTRHGRRRLRRERTAARGEAPASSSASRRSPRCRSASGTIPTATKYRAAYFERFPGVWCHGDWIAMHRARRLHHLRPVGRDAQSRRRAHRHRGDLPAGRAAAGGRSRASPSASSWDGDERIVLFVRLARRRHARRRAARAHREAHPRATRRRATCRRASCRWPTSRGRRAARSSSWRCAA